ncbi:transcription factor IBH1-like [Olea europaea var. sylvestris]|uniref:transcription factor IBH1-like n=1 Tax=Olea europaea var. sylvestris TaxID=158386 RepID=UPI000C1D4162|nr:transcription factor IBH1-like [Olea europaea var. sylvestris]
MTTHQRLPSNLSSVKSRFTYRFLKSLNKLKKNRSASPSIRETYRRYHLIRVASYASMASAVRPRRAWSHATLWKIRNRTFHRALMKRSRTHSSMRRGARGNPREELGFGQVSDLRKLVPGGEEMKFCRLLNETAHYITCLQAQVQIMRNIIDHSSA